MADKQATAKQNEPIEKENGDDKLWRPSDRQTAKHSENPTGLAGKSSAGQTGDPGRTPGKAEGEDSEG